MKKVLTKEQKEEIDGLYREKGWSIKQIARHLHVGDKRVSAYLRGKSGGSGSDKGLKSHQKDCFLITVNEIVKNYEEACNKFSTTLYRSILEEISDLLEADKITKKESEKRARTRLTKLFDASVNVTYSAGCAAIFTMPPRFKKIWMESIMREPKEVMKKKGTTKKAKK